MPRMLVKGKNINYMIHGDGEPIVFLNGIMMSTVSWQAFIPSFSNYKMILIDLIDQGASDKADRAYDQDMHVEMLKELIEGLGIKKVHMMGISYGGEVAMGFALKHEEMLLSLILSNTTPRTNEIMKDIEDAWDYAASTYDGKIFFKATMPYIYSRKFYSENIEWLKKREEQLASTLTKEWYEGFRRAIRSASKHDLTQQLQNIKLPTLVIGSDQDIITPIDYQEEICKRISDCSFLVIKDAGHASMYEKPDEFAACILGFLSTYKKKINTIV